MRAYCLIRQKVPERHAAFMAGLAAAGYDVTISMPGRARAGDVMVIWNRRREEGRAADRFEQDGGMVFVAENGYAGKDANGSQYYALSRHGHNGSGQWPRGDGSR